MLLLYHIIPYSIQLKAAELHVDGIEEVYDVHTARVDRVSLASLSAGDTHARNRVCELPPTASFSSIVSLEFLP